MCGSLRHAVENNRYAQLEYLLKTISREKKGEEANQTDYQKKTALHIATEKNDPRNVRILTSFDIDIDVNMRDVLGKTPLHNAAKNGSREICEMLVTAGAIIDIRDCANQTPVCIAISSGHDALAGWLLSKI